MASLLHAWGAVIPLTGSLRPRARACLRLGMLALLVGLGLYVAHSAGVGRGHLDSLFDDWLYNALLVGAAAACLTRGLVRAERTAWCLLGAGVLCWAVGDVYWTLFLDKLESPPFPSVADVLYLCFYPFVYLALALLVRDSVARFHKSMYLDGLIGVFAVSSLAAAFVIGPILSGIGGSAAAVVTNISYPIFDLLLLVIVIGVFALTGWKPSIGWLAIGVALLMFSLADSLYLYRVAAETYEVGTILDSLWAVGLVGLAFAAWQPLGRVGTVRLEGLPVLVVPFVFTVASLGLLLLGNFGHVNGIALGLAGAALISVFARVALTFEEVRALPETRRQAETDPLTGLANRRYFLDHLRSAIDKAARKDSSLAVLMIDLDRFKELNDTLGHYAGDILLQQLGPRLQEAVRTHELLARLGGDEFAVLLTDGRLAARVAERVGIVLDQSFQVGGVIVQVEASVGIALYPDHATEADGLLQRADVAMYEAKEEHAPYRFYAPDRDQNSPERLSMIGELRNGIDAGELVLHYQPKVELSSRNVTGVEALVRWMHPERGLIPPVEFVPLVEQTGVMRPLTLHVLREAIKEQARLLERGHDLEMSVNISARNLLDGQFPDDLRAILEDGAVTPGKLLLEITENIFMTDSVRATQAMNAVRALGVRMALDDFGTGFSSLSYLKRLPIDELKVDKSFVLNMASDENDAAIVRAVIELSRNLGIPVLAEGVEDAESLHALTGLGCDFAQGFYISRPLPAQELESWLCQRSDRGDPAVELGQPAGLIV